MATFGEFLFGTADSAVSDATGRQKKIGAEYEGTVKQALQPYSDLTDVALTKDLQNEYVGGLRGLKTDQYKVGAPIYDTSSATTDEINTMIDPEVEYQRKKARESLESTAAGEGGLFSTGLGRDVATSDEELSAKAFAEARQNVINEKNRQNAIRQQQFGTDTTAGTYNLGMDTTGINAKGTAYQTMMEPMGTFAQGMMDMAGTKYGADTGMSQQQLQAQGADTGYFGDFLKFGSSFV